VADLRALRPVPVHGTDRLGDVVKLHWEAVAKDGTVFAVGLSVLVLAPDGRIERDYTFIVG